jgi:hypothetical protein
MFDPKFASLSKMIGDLIAEDLQSTLYPRRRCHRSSSRASQVGVIEVGQSIRGSTNLSSHPALFPCKHALVCPDTSEQRTNRISVTNHDTIDAPNFAGFRSDA